MFFNFWFDNSVFICWWTIIKWITPSPHHGLFSLKGSLPTGICLLRAEVQVEASAFPFLQTRSHGNPPRDTGKNKWYPTRIIYNIVIKLAFIPFEGVATRYDLLRKVDSMMTGLILYHCTNIFGEHVVLVCFPVLYIQQLVGMWCHVFFTVAAGCGNKLQCL